MSSENFISEINEELRSDRLRKFWRRFGAWVIAGMVFIVVAVAVSEGWSWWQNTNAARSSDEFYSALQLADGTDIAAAQAALDKVAATGYGGYPVLARFREAALLAKSGKTAEAVAAYDAIATGQQNKPLRTVALVLAAYLLVDGGDVAAVEQRLTGLTGPDTPLRNAAREAIGLVKYKAGDLEGARQSFQSIVDDPLSTSEIRQRVQIFLAQLVAEGVSKPVDAAAAAPATPAAPAVAPAADATTAPAAETSVGTAPALDIVPPAEPTAADAPAPALADPGTMMVAPTDTPAMAPAATPMSPANTLEPAPATPATDATPAPAAPAN